MSDYCRIDDVKLNMEGVREVMGAPMVTELIQVNLEMVADDATADAESHGFKGARYDVVVDKHKHGIPAGHVFPNAQGARAHNETGCLLSAFAKILGGENVV